MPQDTITKVVHIETSYSDAVRGIEEYTRALEDVKEAERDAQEQYEKGEITLEQRNRTLIALKETEKEYKRGIRELSKEIQNNIKQENEQEGSLRSLRAQLSNATKEYDALSRAERNGEAGEKKRAEIVAITNELKAAEEETERFYRNVGNYPGAVEPLKQQLRELVEKLTAMKFAGQENTAEFQELSAKAAQMKDAIADVNAQIGAASSDTAGLDGLVLSTQNLLGLWAQYSVIAGQMGIENKDLNDTFKVITLTLGTLTALQKVQNMLQSQSIVMQAVNTARTKLQAKANAMNAAALTGEAGATSAATIATRLFNAALKANPIVLIVSLIIAAVSAVYGLVKAFNLFGKSQEKARENFKKEGEELDKLAKKYDEHLTKLKAIGKSDEEITNQRLILLRDLSSRQNAHFEEAAKLYKKDKDEYKDALEGKKTAEENYQSALNDTANHLREVVSSYRDDILKKAIGEVEYATIKANANFAEQVKQLKLLRAEGVITANEMFVLQTNLEAARDKQIADARKTAGTSARKFREERLKTELDAVRAATDAEIALIRDAGERELAEENERYSRQIADLKKRLETEKKLTPAARAAITRQIELAEEQHARNLENLDREAADRRYKTVQQEIALRLAAVKEGTEEEYQIRLEQLQTQEYAELTAVGVTEEQKKLIRAKYAKETADLNAEYTNLAIQKTTDALKLEYENRIAELAIQGENTLALEVEMKQREMETLQQLEGESDAAFKARMLAAQQEYVNAKKALADYEVEIETAKMESIATVTGALSDLMSEIGEEDEGFAQFGKMLALAEIAINTGKAIAAGTAQAMSVPYPANLAAIATTVATVLANITSAIKTVKGAKIPSAGSYSTGGYVSGPGSGTSDSVPARLSNGESVNNALSTSLFAPLYSALNQLGGGVPIAAANTGNQIAGEEMLARAVARGVSGIRPVVAVEEIRRVSSRVDVVESLGDV
ncbi:MAG: hypothetical protein IJQ81_06650 [Oscillibacter sp.]|nr:hypothetical protein [Oscillibacter sp.]